MKRTKRLHSLLIGTGSALLVLGGSAAVAQTPHLTRVLAQLPAANTAQPQAQPEPENFAPEAPQKETIVGPKVVDSLFAGTEKFAKGATNVTEVNMGPQSLDLVQGSDAKRAHRTLLSEVRTYSYDKPGMYNPADLDEFRHRIEGGDWQCSVHTRDLKNGTSTDICSRRRTADQIEKVIITMEPRQLTFIHNIRRTDGEGSRLEDQGMDLFLPGVSADLALANVSPELAADLLSAQLRAETAGLAAAHAELPKLDQRDLERQMQELREQLKHLQVPAHPDPHQLNELERQLGKRLQSIPGSVQLPPHDMEALRQQLQQLTRQQGE